MVSLPLHDTGLFTWPAMLVQLSIIAFSLFVWRRYLSPLANIPGPFVASFSRWWHIVTSTSVTRIFSSQHYMMNTVIRAW